MPIEEPEVDDYSAEDIRKQVARVLRDLNNPEPPLKLADVRELLKLDLGYYSKTDLSLFDEVSHRVKVGGKRLLQKPARMICQLHRDRMSRHQAVNAGRLGLQVLRRDSD